MVISNGEEDIMDYVAVFSVGVVVGFLLDTIISEFQRIIKVDRGRQDANPDSRHGANRRNDVSRRYICPEAPTVPGSLRFFTEGK